MMADQMYLAFDIFDKGLFGAMRNKKQEACGSDTHLPIVLLDIGACDYLMMHGVTMLTR